MTYLHAIGTSTPAHQYQQADLLNFMLKWTKDIGRVEQLFLKKVYSGGKIQQRNSILPDFDLNQGKPPLLFEYNQDLPPIEKRMKIFEGAACALSIKSVRHCLEQVPDVALSEITHLITVSCTGLYAPGLDIVLTKELGLNHNIQRTGVNFMGCYAAFHALKMADDICKNQPKAKVLLVATELCTLHFSPEKSLDQMMANALFADGSASVLLSGSRQLPKKSQNYLKIKGHQQKLLPDSRDEMAWRVGPLQFEMVLSKKIPQLIEQHLPSFIKPFVGEDQIDQYAIHPGGANILKAVEKAMNLSPEEIGFSYKILNQCGNMSSASVLFVLAEMMAATPAGKQQILAGGFGPGLNMEAMRFELNQA